MGLMISVVIPTYNEGEVIQETLRRASGALKSSGEEFELIVVDDASADGTAERAEALAGELPVRVLRRNGRLGLATAVMAGWSLARGDVLGVMDADLQHPPEVLGDLAQALRRRSADLAVATRYTAGGGTSRWGPARRFISWGATHLADLALPWSLGVLKDPMSGMFFVRASALRGVSLDPIGYKILLEVLAKARYREVVEVPYVFTERSRGSSKLGAKQYLEFLAHLLRLARSTGQLRAWASYGVVGLVGALVDVVVVYLLAGLAGWHLALALPVAIELALLNNFFWNDKLTFGNRRSGERNAPGVWSRLLHYEKVCAPAALFNAIVTLILARRVMPLVLAAAAGVLSGGAWNFLYNIPTIWRVWALRPSPEAPQRG